ncbi:PKD domain-containing protein [Maribacter halichondriae]|uniref:PKD domain-containing protein n=1 Tax=Maribacter halichondriae TaxID=2980554 RepID=UPI0023595E32|nr:PKD domain-containing protein [Maribacter sp. Hal144]
MAVANLPDGRLITWSSQYPDTFVETGNGMTYTQIFDPSTGTTETMTTTQTDHDMFCPGINNLADGRILSAGGVSSERTSIYDPATGVWSRADDMNINRGYQGNVTLADGSVFTLGGSWSGSNTAATNGGKDGELWSAETGWINKPGIQGSDIFTTADLNGEQQGLYRVDNHLWLWAAPDGRIFHAGPSASMNWIDVSGSGTVTSAGTRGNDTFSMKGTTVMFDTGKILKVGGATSYGTEFNNGIPANEKSFVIDINNPNNVTVTATPNMQYVRTMHNSTVLPDGKVLVTGGLDHAEVFSDTGAALPAELYDPVSNTWETLAAMATPRTYHSVGILMTDGRVFVGGGGLCDGIGLPGYEDCTNHFDAEVYSPPYLFTAGGQLATRPSITNAPATADYDTNISVTTNTAVTEFSLIRFSAATHSTNNEQRRIPLATTGGTSHSLAIPGRNLLPPGYYMLFGLNAAGVPSVAHTIRVGNAVPLTGDPNLVMHLKFDETSGSVAADASGNNNDGTIFDVTDNGATKAPSTDNWSTGLFGGAAQMDGETFQSNTIVDVPYSASLAATAQSITVMAWVDRDDIANNVGILTHDYPAMFFGFHNNLYKWEFATTAGGGDCYSGYSPAGQWVHIAATYDGTTARLFANGVEVCTQAVSGDIIFDATTPNFSSFASSGFYETRDPATNNVLINNNYNQSGVTDEISGKIDELKVYNNALGAQEIKALYDAGVAQGVPACPPGTITAQYRIGTSGPWTDGNVINAPSSSQVYIRAVATGTYYVTTAQNDNDSPTFESGTDFTQANGYLIDPATDIGANNQLTLTTAGGCPTVVTYNVVIGGCEPGNSQVSAEWRINDGPYLNALEGEDISISAELGDTVRLSILPNQDAENNILEFDVSLPSGSVVNDISGDYILTNVSSNQNGVYVLTSSEGCSVIINLNVDSGEPGSCPDYLVNGDASLPLPEGVLASGLDSAVMLEGTGAGPGCQLELTNGDGGEPWAKYRIAIDLAANGISAGDELYFSLAGSGTGGAARFQVARDNRPNTFLVDHAYGTGWSTHSQTVTVPSGLSTLDIWIYPNFGVSSAGSARYGDLVVSKGSAPGDGPTAVVLASPTNGAAPLTVGFTGSGSTDDQPGLSHSWDFGDGSPVSNVADPDHEYTSVGTFDAVLTVTDSDGQTDSGTVRITVTGEPGSCPDYLVNGDASLPLPEGVLASGLDSAVMLEGTGAGPGCQLELTNGDGGEPWAKYRIAIDLAANGISAGDELYFSLAGSGTGGAARFQVARDNRPNTFLVDHAYGTGWSTHSQTVTVPSGLSTLDIWIYPNFGVSSAGSARYGDLVVSKGSAPGDGPTAVVLASPTNGAAPLTVGFTGSGSTDDQPGLSHSWDFGDGSPVSNVADPDHEYTSVGTFDAVLTVTDSDGQTDSGTVRITVTGEPGSCPDYLVNGDASLPLPEGVLASGLDSAVMLEGTGAGPGCQLELTNGDGGEPWAKYRIAIDLAANGISAGDELYFSLAGSGTGGAARFQVARDNRPNTFLVDHAYGTGWSTHSQTVTVPSGLSTLDIWIYPNFGVSSAGSARYGDLVVSKGSALATARRPWSWHPRPTARHR